MAVAPPNPPPPELSIDAQAQIYDLRAEGMGFDAIAAVTGCTPLQAAKYGGLHDIQRKRPAVRVITPRGPRSRAALPAATHLGTNAAAALLGKQPRTIIAWIKKKILPATQIGRNFFIAREALDTLLCKGALSDELATSLISLPDAAKRLQIQPNTLRRWAKAQRVPSTRRGTRIYFREEDLSKVASDGK